MEIKIGDQIKIPFKPDQHLKKTGIPCIVVQIEPKFVYVRRYSTRNQRWNKGLSQLDRKFVEQIKEGQYA